MGGYIARRLLSMLFMLLLLSLVVFLLFSVLPTDPARLTCGKSCTPAIIEANRHRLGLDLPVWQQYWEFLKGLFVGRTYGSGDQTFNCSAPCLGYSFKKGEEVTVLIKDRFPATMWLAIGAFVLWITVGISVGIYAALRRGKWQDKTVMGISLVGYSLPSFFIGLILLFFIILKWQLLPYPAYVPPWENPIQFFQTMILPWIVLAILYAAFYMRLTRNQMLDTLGEDYIRTARAKGLPERIVIRKHALRAGLTPIVTAAGLDLAGLLGGAIITEQIFSLPGLGSLAVSSVQDYDLPLIVGITLITATFIIVANLIVDLLYAVIDPRVRLV
ncbi:MAG TPA: ABC transporter permease [Candidatus Nanopelagicales bacterium]|nr:ABC transporter permease [Candidatus Nanopelagicales bacterium]